MFYIIITLTLITLLTPSTGHQSISWPPPISRDQACRISKHQKCPGPCPHKDHRLDQTPNNPSVTVQRGEAIPINTMANNHRGGFSRWTLVHVRDMFNKQKHRANAFLYTCADLRLTKCKPANKKRDCFYDRQNEYFRHSVRVPTVVPDGVYVLGWVWYGGGRGWGFFGDYYDCMYIQVKGGKFTKEYAPRFTAGPSATAKNGRCVATVNDVGICWKEPCPGGGRPTKLFKPAQFSGKTPKPLRQSQFSNPTKMKGGKRGGVFVRSLTIRSADNPNKVFASSTKGKFMRVRLSKSMKPTVTCEVSGKVKEVAFFINGRKGRVDRDAPYSIAGDWVVKKRIRKYAAWKFDIDKRYITLSCKATGRDGSVHWRNVEVSAF